MSTLIETIRSITGADSSTVSDSVLMSHVERAGYFITSLIPIEECYPILSETTVTSGSGASVPNGRIASVWRNGVKCTKLPDEFSYIYSSDATFSSLFSATKFNPKYYISGNKIYIKPDPTISKQGKIYYVKIFLDTSTESILVKYDSPIIKMASSYCFITMSSAMRKKAYDVLSEISGEIDVFFESFRSELPTWGEITLDGVSEDLRNALDTAKNIISEWGGLDVKSYGGKEDIEMMQALLATAGTELNRARTEIEYRTSQISEYSAKSNSMAEINSGKINTAFAYLRQAEVYLSSINTIIQNANIGIEYFNMAVRLHDEAIMEVNQIVKMTDFGVALQLSQQNEGNRQ